MLMVLITVDHQFSQSYLLTKNIIDADANIP